MEDQARLAFPSLNWSSLFIKYIIPQVHRVSTCAYPVAERATVPYRRRFVGKHSLRYCVWHIPQFLASVIRLIAIWWHYIELSYWLCSEAKSMHSRIDK